MRARFLATGVLLMLGVAGCPVTDDYYLLPADEPSAQSGNGGSSTDAGSKATGGVNTSGSQHEGGKAAQAGSSTGGAGTGGDLVVPTGGAPDAGGAPDPGQAGTAGQPIGDAGAGGVPTGPCVPSTERCNGHDDDCDDVVDEFVCLSDCSGFVLGTDPEHGYMFCRSGRKLNWTDAKKACEDQDMRLAWLDSAAENQAVAQRLDDLGSDAEILFGATDQGNEGDWLWFGGDQFWKGDEDGAPVAGRFNNWLPGTPNNGNNNEDCALLIAMSGGWGDRTCNATYPFVCEQPD